MFDIGKHISNTEAATVSLPPFWGCHLLLRRPNKKTRGKKWHAKSEVTKNTRRGDLTNQRVRTSPTRDLAWVQAELRRSYYKRAKLLHPDIAGEAVLRSSHVLFSMPILRLCDFRHPKQTSNAYGRRVVFLCNSVFLEAIIITLSHFGYIVFVHGKLQTHGNSVIGLRWSFSTIATGPRFVLLFVPAEKGIDDAPIHRNLRQHLATATGEVTATVRGKKGPGTKRTPHLEAAMSGRLSWEICRQSDGELSCRWKTPLEHVGTVKHLLNMINVSVNL